jgi:hypothetical protein
MGMGDLGEKIWFVLSLVISTSFQCAHPKHALHVQACLPPVPLDGHPDAARHQWPPEAQEKLYLCDGAGLGQEL